MLVVIASAPSRFFPKKKNPVMSAPSAAGPSAKAIWSEYCVLQDQVTRYG